LRKTIAACAITALAVGAGTATAAQLITGKQIKDGSVTSADIKNNSLTGRDIGNGSVGMSELSSQVRAALAKAGVSGKDGANGKDGAGGKDGAKGDKGDAGAPGKDGTNGGLPAGFSVTNKSVGLTASGVDFGPYASGGDAGGSLYYKGLNGRPLSDITNLAYTASYSTSDDKPIGVPYLRIFLNEGMADVIFDPTACAMASPVEDAPLTFDVTGGNVRYNDDACDGSSAGQQAWAAVVADHGADVISGIYVTTGFSGGANLSALLTSFNVNGDEFDFGA
jgi:hypothetical protein